MLASANKYFDEAKDFIMQGLSIRLNPDVAEDEENKEKYTVNLEPRELYVPEDEGMKCLPDGSHVEVPAEEDAEEEPVLADGEEILEQEGEEDDPEAKPEVD